MSKNNPHNKVSVGWHRPKFVFSPKWVAAFCAAQRSKGMVLPTDQPSLSAAPKRLPPTGKWYRNPTEQLVILIAVALLLTTVAGCTGLRPEDRFREINVPREKLRQIETLDLKDMQSEEEPPAEPNDAPPE